MMFEAIAFNFKRKKRLSHDDGLFLLTDVLIKNIIKIMGYCRFVFPGNS